MLFQTSVFVLLFCGTLLTFYRLPRGFRLPTLATSSLLFYAASGFLDFALLLSVLVISYQLSLRVRPGGPRWPLFIGICLIFGSLGYFKYGWFLYQNTNDLFSALNIPSLPRFGGAILPLGISFYTFQITAYLIDIYKGRAESGIGFLKYTVFIMFFGQLIAGPIMRASEYVGQLGDLKGANRDDVRVGIVLILIGVVKKVIIADSIATMVDVRFADVDTLTQADAWAAAYLFTFQIFFDFSGYVSIALGLGRLFGIRLTENFRTPYLSRGPSEFWSRWHITLSSWFRDYMYIPLGGNRKGRIREIINLMAVMVIAGLWHGAGWQFVLWGAVHGVYLISSRLMPSNKLQQMLTIHSSVRKQIYDGLSVFIFFHLTVLAWIPFRSPDLSSTVGLAGSAFRFDGIAAWVNQGDVLALIAGLFALHIAERVFTEHIPIRNIPVKPMRRIILVTLVAAIMFVVFLGLGTSGNNFIYFRF